MVVKFPLAVVISAIDAASPTLAKTAGGLVRLGGVIQGLGKGLALTWTPAVAALGAVTFNAAADFEQSLLKIQAATGAGVAEMARAREAAKGFAELGVGPRAAASGMLAFARAGLNVQQQLQVMTPTMLLARNAEADVGAVAGDVVNIMKGFRLEFDQTSRVVDTLTWASDQTTNNLDDLAQALRLAGPVAATTNSTFEETVGILALMGQGGFTATLGGTALRGFISDMGRIVGGGATEVQRSALERLKISAKELSNGAGGMRNLVEVLELLEQRGANGIDLMALFGERGGPGLAALLNQGTGALRSMIRAFGDQGVGSAARKAEIVLNGPAASLEKLRAEFELLQVAIAESGFLAWATEAVRGTTAWLAELKQTNPELLRLGTIALGATAALGPMLYVLGGIVGLAGKLAYSELIPWVYRLSTALVTTAIPAAWAFTTALLANPVTWVVLGIAALGVALAALIVYWDDVVDAMKAAWNWMVKFVQAVPYDFLSFFNADAPQWARDLRNSDLLLFDRASVDTSPANSPAAAARAQVRPQESRVRVDFTNLPRGAEVTTDKAAGGFELNTGFAMGG